MATAERKRLALRILFVGLVKLTVFVGALYVYGHTRPEPPGTFRKGSPAYDFVSDCFEMIGSSREKAGFGPFAFCQCYATELQRRKTDEEDFPLLLRVIEGERPTLAEGEDVPATRPADVRLPVHLQDLVDSTLPKCRAKAEKVATAEGKFNKRK